MVYLLNMNLCLIISINNTTLSNFIGEICISLSRSGIKNIIILNCHHGNSGILQYIHQNISSKVNTDTLVNFVNYWHLINDFDSCRRNRNVFGVLLLLIQN